VSKVDYLIREIRGQSDPLNPPRAPFSSSTPSKKNTGEKKKKTKEKEISQHNHTRSSLTAKKWRPCSIPQLPSNPNTS